MCHVSNARIAAAITAQVGGNQFNRHYFITHYEELNFLRMYVVVGCAQTCQCDFSYNFHLLRKNKGKDFEGEARKFLLSSGVCYQGENHYYC